MLILYCFQGASVGFWAFKLHLDVLVGFTLPTFIVGTLPLASSGTRAHPNLWVSKILSKCQIERMMDFHPR